MSKKPLVSEADSEDASRLAEQMRAVLGRMKRRLREHGEREDLKPSQVSVLLRLERDGASTVSSLARAEGMRPQSMSSIITSLQEAGLIDSASDPNDGRKTLMSLSRKCEKLLQKTRAARQDWLTTVLLKKLSAVERQQLATTLALFDRLTEEDTLS